MPCLVRRRHSVKILASCPLTQVRSGEKNEVRPWGLHRLEVKLRTERRRSLCPGKGGKAPDRASTYGEQFTVHMREEIPT